MTVFQGQQPMFYDSVVLRLEYKTEHRSNATTLGGKNKTFSTDFPPLGGIGKTRKTQGHTGRTYPHPSPLQTYKKAYIRKAASCEFASNGKMYLH
jgi:hypothetical protein